MSKLALLTVDELEQLLSQAAERGARRAMAELKAKPSEPAPIVVTLREASEQLKVSRDTLRRRLYSNKISVLSRKPLRFDLRTLQAELQDA